MPLLCSAAHPSYHFLPFLSSEAALVVLILLLLCFCLFRLLLLLLLRCPTLHYLLAAFLHAVLIPSYKGSKLPLCEVTMLAEPSPSPISTLAMNGGTHVERVHRPETNSIQIPRTKTVNKDDESIASGSTASIDSQMKKRLSVDMSKEQVEDLVRKLTIDEMKTRWFDEIFEKVKSERKLYHFSSGGSLIMNGID